MLELGPIGRVFPFPFRGIENGSRDPQSTLGRRTATKAVMALRGSEFAQKPLGSLGKNRERDSWSVAA